MLSGLATGTHTLRPTIERANTIVREPGASRGNFLLKLWDLSSDVYYMLPNRKNMLALWKPARSKMAAIFQNGHYFLSVLFEKGLE